MEVTFKVKVDFRKQKNKNKQIYKSFNLVWTLIMFGISKTGEIGANLMMDIRVYLKY